MAIQSSNGGAYIRVFAVNLFHIRFIVGLLIIITIIAGWPCAVSTTPDAERHCPPDTCCSPAVRGTADDPSDSEVKLLVECEPPMVEMIGSRSRTEKRSRRMRFETVTTTMMTSSYGHHQTKVCHTWKLLRGNCITHVNTSSCEDDEIKLLPGHIATDAPSLLVPKCTLNQGVYCLKFQSKYRCGNSWVTSDWVDIDLKVTSSAPIALIKGGHERTVMFDDQLRIDGSLSYNSDVNDAMTSPSDDSLLVYTWTCQLQLSENSSLEDCTEWLLSNSSMISTVDVIILPRGSLRPNVAYYVILTVQCQSSTLRTSTTQKVGDLVILFTNYTNEVETKNQMYQRDMKILRELFLLRVNKTLGIK